MYVKQAYASHPEDLLFDDRNDAVAAATDTSVTRNRLIVVGLGHMSATSAPRWTIAVGAAATPPAAN